MRQCRFRRRQRHILAQHRAHRRFLLSCAPLNHVRDDGSEKIPPQLNGPIETADSLRPNDESLLAEQVCGALNGRRGLSGGSTQRVAFQNPNFQTVQFPLSNFSYGHGRRKRVARVRTCHHFKQRAHI